MNRWDQGNGRMNSLNQRNGGQAMEKMTKKEMIDFLRGFKRKKALLAEDKESLKRIAERR